MSSSPECELTSYEPVRDLLNQRAITNLRGVASAGSSFAFISQEFYPIYYNSKTETCCLLKGKATTMPEATSVAISADEKLIVSGHSDGSYSIWDVPKMTLVKQIPRKEQGNSLALTAIAFNMESTHVFAASMQGKLYGLALNNSKETELCFLDTSVKKILCPPAQSGIVIAMSDIDYAIMSRFEIDAQLAATKASDKKPITFIKSPRLFDPPIFDFTIRNGETRILSAAGTQLKYQRVVLPPISNDPKKKTVITASQIKLDPLAEIELSFSINSAVCISPTIMAAISSTGAVNLVSCEGKIIYETSNEQIQQLMSNVVSVLSQEEHIIIVTENECHEIGFQRYDSKLEQMGQQGQWDQAFKAGDEVFQGTSLDLLGLPTNQSKRRLEIQKLMCAMMTQFLSNSIQSDSPKAITAKVCQVLKLSIRLECVNFITKTAFEQFKQADKLGPFFDGIFVPNLSDSSSLCTGDFIRDYLQYADEQGQIAQAEKLLLNFKYDIYYVKTILPHAYQHKCMKLTQFLLEEYLHDYVTTCQLFYESGQITQYFDEIFKPGSKAPDSARRSLAVWAFFPTRQGGFERLHALFSADWKKADKYVETFLSLLPIQYTLTRKIEISHAVDAILRVVTDVPFEDAEPILNRICPYFASQGLQITGVAIKHILNWIFNSSYHDMSHRERTLMLVIDKYPNIIPSEKLVKYAMNCGFVGTVQEALLPSKQYTQIFATALLNQQFRSNVFQLIEDHSEDKEELKAAIQANFPAMLLTSATRTASIVHTMFPEIEKELINTSSPYQKFIFMRALLDLKGVTLDRDEMMTLFELVCKYDAKNAVSFLNEHGDELDTTKAQEMCLKSGRVDCSVQILQQKGDLNGAVKQISDEIERSLIDYEENEPDVNVVSIDELSDKKEVEQVLNNIRVAIDLLSQINDGSEIEKNKRWQIVFARFQFPLYHVQKKKPHTIHTIILLFSYFVVESLTCLKSEFVFTVLSIYFAGLQGEQYRQVLSNIFSRLDYQAQLNQTVEKMLTKDCLELVDAAFSKTTHGIQSDPTAKCQACQESLMKEKFVIFPCGHCYHDTEQCGKPKSCPLCTGAGTSSNAAASTEMSNKISTRRIQQLMRRLDFALRRNFGAAVEDGEKMSQTAYFARSAPPSSCVKISFDSLGINMSEPIKITIEPEKDDKAEQ